MRFDGAIFDVDGVLVDTPHEHAWRESMQRLMDGPWQEIAPQTTYSPDAFTTAVYQAYVAGKPREAGAKAAMDYFGIPDPDGTRLREYCDTKQAMIVELIERGDFVAFGDALRFLLELKSAGVKIGAASSSKNANLFLSKVSVDEFVARGGMQDKVLTMGIPAGATLLDMFDANISGRTLARGKPDPEIFLTAASELHLPPERCFVLEDAVSGVQAAKAGGMFAIGVARLNRADIVVTSLDQVAVASLLSDTGK
jgi:beta-phosphoglucomutase-like phosphatase (HAD superfamily)